MTFPSGPIVYYVGAGPITDDDEGRYQGVLQETHPPDEERRVVWRCEHRHRFARRAWDCSVDEAIRRRTAS